MAPLNGDSNRVDPYRPFRYRIRWDNRIVAGVSRVSALQRGRREFEPITLEAGVTHDQSFVQWANRVWSYGARLDKNASLADFRRDVAIYVLNDAGLVVLVYNVYRCWVSELTAQHDHGGGSDAVLITSLQLQNEGWEQDQDHAAHDPNAASSIIPA